MSRKADLLQGTLELLVLTTLRSAPLHGWGIGKHIERTSREVLSVGQGSLYPALYRLENKGLIQSEWSESPEGRRVKVYSLTPSGRRQFEEERASWRLFSSAVEEVLHAV